MRGLAVIVSAILASAVSAYAAEPVPVKPSHEIDMTVVLHDEGGKPLKDPTNRATDDPKCDHCPTLTLGHLVAGALFNVVNRDERNQVTDKPEALWARGMLAEKLRDAKAATLTAEQITEIKALVAKGYPSPVVIMQVYPLLDPNAKPPG